MKFPLHLWSAHEHASFVSMENSVMSGTEKGFEETAATILETKSPNCLAMLVINYSINWKYLESSCFYFPQNGSENDYRKFVLNDMFENIIVFLKRANSSDQIKSSTVCFSLCSFTFKSLRCYTMSAKKPTASFIISWKRWKYLRFSSHIVDFPRKNKISFLKD